MAKKQNKKNNEKEKINFKENIREYWSILRKHKYLFFSLIFTTFLINALGIIDKFLFRRIIDDGEKFISDNLSKEAFIEILIIIAVIFVVVLVLRTLIEWLNLHNLIKLDLDTSLNLKEKYFNHLLKLSHNFHQTHKTGSLISRLTRGSNAVERMSDTIIFNFTPLFFNLIIVGATVTYFSFYTGIVVLLMSVAFILYSWYIQKKQENYKILFNKNQDYERGFISDIFTNIDSIKYFGKEKLIKNKYRNIARKTKRSAHKFENYFKWLEAGQTFILGVGLAFLILFPLIQFLNGEISLGTLTFIYTAYTQLVGPLMMFVGGLRGFYINMADFQELFEYGKIEQEVKDKPRAKNLKITKGEIEFKDVTFHYGKKRAFSLNNFNLKIKPNEKIALVGPSGCGKTTLVKLLYRMHDVQRGKIKIDGQNISDIKQESLRSEMSIVPQEAILFDDTIYNNIKFANPKAKKKEVREAIKFAQLDKFIDNLPQKENTIVGERGVKLSGGEKQRVSIARAILANKKILILDEATSSLDSETENEIQKSLKNLLKGRTSILIAHRLSTIMNADRIIVMKNGKIIQEGNHEKLINQEGEYKKLWNMQKGG
ncbi:MAG: ABC transporter ATP-binding protein, partial [Minisyncoccales bacterium]